MRFRKHITVSIGLAQCFVSLCFAGENDLSHRGAAIQFVDVIFSQVDEMYEREIGHNPQIAHLKEVGRKFFHDYMTDLRGRMADELTRHFTEPELKELSRIYASPVFQKIMRRQKQLESKSEALVEEYLAQHPDELRAITNRIHSVGATTLKAEAMLDEWAEGLANSMSNRIEEIVAQEFTKAELQEHDRLREMPLVVRFTSLNIFPEEQVLEHYLKYLEEHKEEVRALYHKIMKVGLPAKLDQVQEGAQQSDGATTQESARSAAP